jgi:hypothetical protein
MDFEQATIEGKYPEPAISQSALCGALAEALSYSLKKLVMW